MLDLCRVGYGKKFPSHSFYETFLSCFFSSNLDNRSLWVSFLCYLKSSLTDSKAKISNCQIKEDYPLQAKCFTKNVVYKAIIYSGNDENFILGLQSVLRGEVRQS